jgi:hypothetical protein
VTKFRAIICHQAARWSLGCRTASHRQHYHLGSDMAGLVGFGLGLDFPVAAEAAITAL